MTTICPDHAQRHFRGPNKPSLRRYLADPFHLAASLFGPPRITPGKRLVFAGGLYSSGTTWTFNILRNVALARGHEVLGFYSDNLKPTQMAKLHRHDTMIVKTHVLGPKSADLVRRGEAKLFLPVRDPRDAICSLMKRFGSSFPTALEMVAASTDNILDTQIILPHMALRFEDRFFENPGAVTRICDYFGTRVTDLEAKELIDCLKPEKVQSIIRQLEQNRTIDPKRAQESADRQTNWHPNHVGDRRVGKYRDMLSHAQIAQINDRTGRFMEQFGY